MKFHRNIGRKQSYLILSIMPWGQQTDRCSIFQHFIELTNLQGFVKNGKYRRLWTNNILCEIINVRLRTRRRMNARKKSTLQMFPKHAFKEKGLRYLRKYLQILEVPLEFVVIDVDRESYGGSTRLTH